MKQNLSKEKNKNKINERKTNQIQRKENEIYT